MEALKILHLEDNANDAELVGEALRGAGVDCQITRVLDRAGFVGALDRSSWDLILADYALPSFDGLSALKVVAERALETPFIFVTGAMGEDVAVESLKHGATDYVLKSALPRLPSAVQRAIQEVAERQRRREADNALRSSEARLAGIIESAMDAIITVDETQCITLFNPAAEKLFGCSAAEALGGALDRFIPERLRSAHHEHLIVFGRSGVTSRRMGRQDSVLGLRGDGAEFPAEVSISQISVAGNKLFTAIVRDVTERKRAEEEIRQLNATLEQRIAERTAELEDAIQALKAEAVERKAAEQALARLQGDTELILDSAGEAISRLDLDGKCTFVNPAASRILGYSKEELLGQDLHVFLQHRLSDGSACPLEHCQIQRSLKQGIAETAENQIFTRKDGSSIYVDSVTAPITEDGEIVGAVQLLHDVSERRAMEKMKEEFVSVVSHELRTPLTAIRGALGLMSAGKISPLPPRVQRMVEIAINNTDRLVRLVGDILDSARLEREEAALVRKLTDASELMMQARDLMRPMAETAEVKLDVQPQPLTLCVDGDAILQALSNLLSNAIKFSPPSSAVRFECRQEGGCAEFRVIDQGPGIPKNKLESIFDRFQPVDASDSRRRGGTGLGLSICRRIVQLHGGRIWAESEPGHGSTFIFTLPLAPGENLAEHEVTNVDTGQGPARPAAHDASCTTN